jgi:two-component system CheB/CheR fusion protein
MPSSAIQTNDVDLVLKIADMPAALIHHYQWLDEHQPSDSPTGAGAFIAPTPPSLHDIIALLRLETTHDFTLYKHGTLQRRIERRMSMAGLQTGDVAGYIAMLRASRAEIDALANDLLINVTSFFRDSRVFDFLASHTIPDLVRRHVQDQSLRVWIAGCSTGEETYSLAILLREAITAEASPLKLQVFASDVDADAVAVAREGVYPETIAAEVSAARLARFFKKEPGGYRVVPELRGCVVFTVQDLLSDPPFSRIDLLSCRNLLIYLQPEAQAMVMSAFHFALNEGGILVLGASETVGQTNGRFEVISKAERIYRHTARSHPGELAVLLTAADGPRPLVRAGQGLPLARQAALAERCRRLVIEQYAPAAILINRRHECLFFLGPTDRYLRVAQGHATQNLLAMVRPGLRQKLRSAVDQAMREKAPASVSGGRMMHDGKPVWFRITAQHLPGGPDDEDLLLVCFIDEQRGEPIAPSDTSNAPERRSRITALEQELEATRADLRDAQRDVEIAGEEHNAIHEEALSVNEEYQSTNEELLTSKEELQSLNEELTALNGQLQETLERQRTTANDLQNILYSTDIATLFLDINLDIRFFTPATRAIFNIIPGDIGRPLADLHSLAGDTALLSDARTILQTSLPIEREIEVRRDAQKSAWFIRRVSLYRGDDNHMQGVVITFTDITERKFATSAVQDAQIQAESANLAKSRFLAAASHDLRQPLQTLVLLQGLLTKKAEGTETEKLVALLEPTLSAMSGMLNTLLDINQIDAGTVQPERRVFAVDEILSRLNDEFSYLAQAQDVGLRVVRSGLFVQSDPRLLEQMLRNLLSNALKYTRSGRVLMDCRRSAQWVRIEIWDTGIGIPEAELAAIFDEYHQVGNAARDRNHGLGLGLSIVQRLAKLLGHRVRVRSTLGRGSMFAIEIARPRDDAMAPGHLEEADAPPAPTGRVGTILVLEDDNDLRALLEQSLLEEGHLVAAVADGAAALALVERGGLRPDLILADFNLPGGIDGLTISVALRMRLQSQVPVIILTGDISTTTLREVAKLGYAQLNKPVKLAELTCLIATMLPPAVPRANTAVATMPALSSPLLYVVDDDRHIREGLRRVLEEAGFTVETYASCEVFLAHYHAIVHSLPREACLLLDAWLPGMSGLSLLQSLRASGSRLPVIMITGNSDVSMAVQAMKAGASDFIEKPIRYDDLVRSVRLALERSRDSQKGVAWHVEAANHIAELTLRQRQVMAMVLAGEPSKNIAADLGISQRTVENHRAAIMKKTGVKSLPALARLAVAATQTGGDSDALQAEAK